MRKYFLEQAGFILILFAFIFISWTPATTTKHYSATSEPNDTLYSTYIQDLYLSAQLAQSGLPLSVFEKAVTGFYNLKNAGKLSGEKSILSIADFDQSSTKKRLWIIDLDKKTLLLNTWVAHGERSGADQAIHFSNRSESLESSIGFYVTGEMYRGKHGISLKLDGMDEGFNSNARKRSIVVHGADYVSQETIDVLGRLGRSQGCPAVPADLAPAIIHAMEGKTVLFISVNDQQYTSKYLDEHAAAVLASNSAQKTNVLDTV
jgi:hypothetical protein